MEPQVYAHLARGLSASTAASSEREPVLESAIIRATGGSSSRGSALSGVLRRFVGWIAVGALLPGCPPSPPPAEIAEPHPLERIARSYWAEGEGSVLLSGTTVPGRIRVGFSVGPDEEVTVSHLAVWMGDLDLRMPLPGASAIAALAEALKIEILEDGVELVTEALRCTAFRNEGPLTGTLQGDRIVLPAGVGVTGRSWFERSGDGTCHGEARVLDSEIPEPLRVLHDPEADRFALSATFVQQVADVSVTVDLETEGHYLNRPPVAVLRAKADGLETAEDGCPVTDKGDPPLALANTEQGLEIGLISESHDPDGRWPESIDRPKLLRVDLRHEQWWRSAAEGMRLVATGPGVEQLLFETGREHVLMLRVVDRRGAEDRRVCHFQVVEPE